MDLEVRLLELSSTDVAPVVRTIPVSTESDIFSINYQSNLEVDNFGNGVDKVVLILNGIPRAGSCAGDRTFHIITFSYTYKVLGETHPPTVKVNREYRTRGRCDVRILAYLNVVDHESGIAFVTATDTKGKSLISGVPNSTPGVEFREYLFTIEMFDPPRTFDAKVTDNAGNATETTIEVKIPWPRLRRSRRQLLGCKSAGPPCFAACGCAHCSQSRTVERGLSTSYVKLSDLGRRTCRLPGK